MPTCWEPGEQKQEDDSDSGFGEDSFDEIELCPRRARRQTADPCEQTTDPRELAKALAASKRVNVRASCDPAELEKALAASRVEHQPAHESKEALDAALAESRAYEASREDEALRRRCEAEDAAAASSKELAALNATTLDACTRALAGDAAHDASAALSRITATYLAAATAIKSRRRVAPPSALCRGCRQFHGSYDLAGLCSACAQAGEVRSAELTCGDEIRPFRLLRRTFKRVAGAARGRSRLPAPPGVDDRRTGRELLAARLARHGRELWPVEGDGACQFRALSHGIFGDEDHHPLVRRKALEVLRDRAPATHDSQVYVSGRGGGVGTLDVGDDLPCYLAALEGQGAWGDQNTLQAAADAFRCRILLVTTHKANHDLVIDPRDVTATSEIMLGFHSEMHYVSSVPSCGD